MPVSLTGSTDCYVGEMRYASDVTAMPTILMDGNYMEQLVDFKMTRGTRYIKKYVNLAKVYRKTAELWKKEGEYYDQKGTLFVLHGGGFTNGMVLGRFKVTWYVQFKGYNNETA